ncbi:pyocin knob domain-containing protein [Eubacteriales bacterium OttesenSCG-928-N13]|nr:pyocin knob domain-containing protein [Eubacteriales bacterium OttesenSCG-928-N13]
MKKSTEKENGHLYRIGLQLFAEPGIDWRRIMETKNPEEEEGGEAEAFAPKPIFQTMGGAEEEGEPGEGSEVDDEDEYELEPIYMPRLNVTDQNLPHLAAGEMVVADDEGNLMSVAVDNEGSTRQSALQVSGDMIADESISGAKLEEGTITSREIDMEELFSGSMLMNQMLSANIDAEELFGNDAFVQAFNEQYRTLAPGQDIEAMSLNELTVPGRYLCKTRGQAAAIRDQPTPGNDELPEGEEGDTPTGGFSVDVILLGQTEAGTCVQQVYRSESRIWVRFGRTGEQAVWQAWLQIADSAQLSEKVDKSGGAMNGPLTLSGNPTANLHAATKQYVDSKTRGITTRTIALPAYGGWTDSQYTAPVEGVTSTSTVWVSPDADSYINYNQYRIRCIGQGMGRSRSNTPACPSIPRR